MKYASQQARLVSKLDSTSIISTASNHIHASLAHPHTHASLLVLLTVTLRMVVLVLQEEMLVHAVDREGNRRGSKAGERPLEPVPPREGTGIAPSLTTILSALVPAWVGRSYEDGSGTGGVGSGQTDARSQGSYLGWPEAAFSFFMSKPVMLGFAPRGAARSILRKSVVSHCLSHILYA